MGGAPNFASAGSPCQAVAGGTAAGVVAARTGPGAEGVAALAYLPLTPQPAGVERSSISQAWSRTCQAIRRAA
jgi:hypothetical protein